MIDRLRRCADQSALCVAAGTGRIGRTKGGTDVAAFTGDIGMRTVKNEPCAEVIKLRLLCFRRNLQQ